MFCLLPVLGVLKFWGAPFHHCSSLSIKTTFVPTFLANFIHGHHQHGHHALVASCFITSRTSPGSVPGPGPSGSAITSVRCNGAGDAHSLPVAGHLVRIIRTGPKAPPSAPVSSDFNCLCPLAACAPTNPSVAIFQRRLVPEQIVL